MLILVVEDDENLSELVKMYLEREGFSVKMFNTSDGVLEYAQKKKIDAAVLDVMLPGPHDGFELCQALRKDHSFPIIMLTARVQQEDRIQGLSKGADDYLTKPFFPIELVARVKAQLRRAKIYSQPQNNSTLEYGGVFVDSSRSSIRFGDKTETLTPIELSILRLLFSQPNKTHSTQEIFSAAWDDPWLETAGNTVMVHIRHIRQKLERVGAPENFIRTVWGVGYRIGD